MIFAEIYCLAKIEAQMSPLVPSWPLLVGLAALIRTLAEPMALLNDADTYLHTAPIKN